MEMEGMEGAILIFMLGNMEQTVARKQTKRVKSKHRNHGIPKQPYALLFPPFCPFLCVVFLPFCLLTCDCLLHVS